MSKRKTPSETDNLNNDFCEFLMELADYEKNINRNVHKYNAYRKAASVLAAHTTRIKSGDEARKLNGIGEKISKKIDEYLQTGKVKKLENIHYDEHAQAISLLTRVSGIGPVKAADLVKSGVKTIDDLNKNKHKLTHHQLIGLKYFEDFEKKIPRSEIQGVEAKMKQIIINELHTDFIITICGSGVKKKVVILMCLLHIRLSKLTIKIMMRERERYCTRLSIYFRPMNSLLILFLSETLSLWACADYPRSIRQDV
ncbi:unnamed protein product [Leptidea sinapis]|uniref:DNA polymerase n=1 Tax=Leptidea sinapis TaxID=189913 RepID=A0A5E4R279_9NEOP|nr:unnamed protein product [Leptidea sinapis]